MPKQRQNRSAGKTPKKKQHDASHLYYDFWLACLKLGGYSLNPFDKRLVMVAEDHPYDYKDFEYHPQRQL